MKRGFKKHIAFGTILSITLLVGSFQAVPDFKGALSTALNSRVCNNMVTQSLPGQVAMAAAGANLIHTVAYRVVTGKKLSSECPVAGYENSADKKSVRLGAFQFGLNLPTGVESTDTNGSKVVSKVSTLDKLFQSELFVEGVTLPNVVKTAVLLGAVKLAANKLVK